jgi:hypothetical protein
MIYQITLWLMLVVSPLSSFASDSDFSYRNRTDVGAGDYLFRSQGLKKDPVFDEFRTVDVGVNLGIGSDCGRVDFKSTLQASLKNVLDSRYFGDMGKDIMAGSPMLLTCYFSPTWCAILKHSQLNANFMSQMRLNQCALVDKYVDSRVGDYYEERQTCVHKEIEKNGGDIESAMQSCNSGKMYDADLTNWAGSKYGEKASTNKLIEGSARWAGLDTADGKDSIKLVQSLVGDTVVTKGNVSVEYGNKSVALTPRTHLTAVAEETNELLCKKLMGKVDEDPDFNSDRAISRSDLESVGSVGGQLLIDRQTVRRLSRMPYRTRALYCKRLADSVAAARFADQMNRSLDILSVASQNPNLPDKRKEEIVLKRRQLKDSVEETLELQRETNAPLNQVLSQINQQGSEFESVSADRRFTNEASQLRVESARQQLMDCSDGFMCERKH